MLGKQAGAYEAKRVWVKIGKLCTILNGKQ